MSQSKTLSFKDKIIKHLAAFIVKFLWLTCKVKVIGEDKIIDTLQSEQTVIPCYWHQHHVFGLWYIFRLYKKFGKKVGVLASPSRDGEIPSQIMQAWGLHIIRGSSSKTGAQALRDLCKSVSNDGISPSITPDGPRGPIYESKPGPILLAQYTSSPIIPISVSASRYWCLRSWDKFMIPKPFSTITIGISDAIYIDKKLPVADLEKQQKLLSKALNETE